MNTQKYFPAIKALFLLIFHMNGYAQKDSASANLKINGYVEAYYTYDFSNPGNHTRPGFIYSYNRHNEISPNLAYLKATFDNTKTRANVALMTGSYANANLAAEPGVLKNIYEANAGVKISKKNDLWIDAGVFASHIGFESAHAPSCWNLTRSILADNSPYYESGAKISYTSGDDKWFLSGLVLNGWQRIQKVDGNNTPSFGTQITFKPNSKILLNSSSFAGSDTPDNSKIMRYFHNFYGQFFIGENLGIITGFDFGVQQKNKDDNEFNIWYSPVLISKYALTDKLNVAARAEYYADENQVIITTGTPNGFQTFGYSLNFDYTFSEYALWRIEGRSFTGKDKIFTSVNTASNQNYFVSTSLAISF